MFGFTPHVAKSERYSIFLLHNSHLTTLWVNSNTQMVFKKLFGSLAWPGTKKIAKKYLKIANIINLEGKMLNFSIKVRLKPNNGHVFTIIFSIFNRGLNPNTLQVFKKMLGSPYKARGLIVVGTDEIINNQGMASVVRTGLVHVRVSYYNVPNI